MRKLVPADKISSSKFFPNLLIRNFGGDIRAAFLHRAAEELVRNPLCSSCVRFFHFLTKPRTLLKKKEKNKTPTNEGRAAPISDRNRRVCFAFMSDRR